MLNNVYEGGSKDAPTRRDDFEVLAIYLTDIPETDFYVLHDPLKLLYNIVLSKVEDFIV